MVTVLAAKSGTARTSLMSERQQDEGDSYPSEYYMGRQSLFQTYQHSKLSMKSAVAITSLDPNNTQRSFDWWGRP
jgi:hypothetical protein